MFICFIGPLAQSVPPPLWVGPHRPMARSHPTSRQGAGMSGFSGCLLHALGTSGLLVVGGGAAGGSKFGADSGAGALERLSALSSKEDCSEIRLLFRDVVQVIVTRIV